jgi:CMP-N-acetylneuraminic acid synthetase
MTKCIAIIPARGGSKRLHRNNIYPLFDKALIGWSIQAAQSCKLLDEVYVSTEDAEIAATASEFGASIIRRPATLADDVTPNIEVIRHAFKYLSDRQECPDLLVSLQANSPELCGADIDRAIQLLQDNALWEVFSVNADGVQNAAIRVIHPSCLFNTFLSAHLGIIQTRSMDVHTLEDIKAVEERFGDAASLLQHQ